MRVFVDTSALYAVVDAGDSRHRDAADLFRMLLGTAHLLTTNYVLVESDQLVRRRLGNEAADQVRDELLPPISVIWVDEATHRAAQEAQRASPGTVSLVDHVSFVTMAAAGIPVAFAFDHDFDRRGFRTLGRGDLTPERRFSESAGTYRPDVERPDLVSVAEIGARSGRPTNTVQSWRRRHRDFPAPIAALAAGPVWLWPDVAGWLDRRPAR